MDSNKNYHAGDVDHRIRPIAPHLSIYKPQITSTLSIFHRITGTVLTLALVAFIFGFKFYSFYGTNYFIYSIADMISHNSNWLITTLFFLLLFTFYYHTCNGIRHLLWDLGYGFDLESVYKSGYIVVIVSFILTVITWILPAIF